MAISTISISLDSFKESVGTPSGRVLWFGRIPTTMPVTTPTIDPPVIHDDPLLIPTETPTISPITSTIPPTAPTTHYTSLFTHTNSSDNDTPDTPPPPTHEIPPVDVAPPTDYFTSDDSSRDLPLDSSSETPSDSSSDALSDSSSGHSFFGSFITSTTIGSGYPTTSIPVSSPVPGALSYVCAYLLPPRKRIRSFDSMTDLEDYSDEKYESSVPRETSLRDDVVVRADGIDIRVVVETGARDEVETSERGMLKVRVYRVMHHVVSDDIPEPTQEGGAIKVAHEALGDMGSRAKNCSYGPAECCSVREDQTMPNTRSGVTMIRKAVDNLIDRRVAKALEAHDAAQNHKPLAEGGDEQGDENGDDYVGRNRGVNGYGNHNGNEGGNDNRNGNGNDNRNNNGNRGGNGYENHNMNFEGFRPVARECTYQDFLKCQPRNFKGMEELFR
nr:hypothetical protein [Tanacetum cinerariifolium]